MQSKPLLPVRTALYSFVNLNPGEYTVDVEKSRLQALQARSRRRAGATECAALTSLGSRRRRPDRGSHRGDAAAATHQTSLGQVIDERKTNEIPLNGRNVFNLITLSPAAIAARQRQCDRRIAGWSESVQLGQLPSGRLVRQRERRVLDGQPVNIGYINLPVLIPDQDAISEFKVQYNNLGPEWGKFAGGIVNLSTKGGTNQYHGEAYEYLRNKVLNSRPYFDAVESPLRAESVWRHVWWPGHQRQDVLLLRL